MFVYFVRACSGSDCVYVLALVRVCVSFACSRVIIVAQCAFEFVSRPEHSLAFSPTLFAIVEAGACMRACGTFAWLEAM